MTDFIRHIFAPIFPAPVDRSALPEDAADPSVLVAQARAHAALFERGARLLVNALRDVDALCTCFETGDVSEGEEGGAASDDPGSRPCFKAHIVANAWSTVLASGVDALRSSGWSAAEGEFEERIGALFDSAGQFQASLERHRARYRTLKGALRLELDQDESRDEQALRRAWPRVEKNLRASPMSPTGWDEVLTDADALVRLMTTKPADLAAEKAANELGFSARTGWRRIGRVRELAEPGNDGLRRPDGAKPASSDDCHEDGEG